MPAVQRAEHRRVRLQVRELRIRCTVTVYCTVDCQFVT